MSFEPLKIEFRGQTSARPLVRQVYCDLPELIGLVDGKLNLAESWLIDLVADHPYDADRTEELVRNHCSAIGNEKCRHRPNLKVSDCGLSATFGCRPKIKRLM